MFEILRKIDEPRRGSPVSEAWTRKGSDVISVLERTAETCHNDGSVRKESINSKDTGKVLLYAVASLRYSTSDRQRKD